MKRYTGTISVIAAGCLWGIIGIFVRRLSAAGMTSIQIAAIRIFVTAFILFTGLLLFNRRLLYIRFRHIWCFVGTGLISIVVFSYCYFRTMETASLSAAAVLLYTAPVMVMIMSAALFREKITIIKIIACILSLSGCILVTGILSSGDKLPTAAIITGLVSALGYALYSIFGRFALNYGYNSLTITAYTFVFACIGVLPLCGLPDLIIKMVSGDTISDIYNIILGVLLGLVTAALPYVLYTAGLSKIESGRASVIASVEPVVATIAGAAAFGEKLTLQGFAGIALVVAAVILMNIKKKQAHLKQNIKINAGSNL
ncbi:MAG: DMT family transporter [Eubacteriales bacterium]